MLTVCIADGVVALAAAQSGRGKNFGHCGLSFTPTARGERSHHRGGVLAFLEVRSDASAASGELETGVLSFVVFLLELLI